MQIVAIGASAGGIEAFRLFFEAMPADSGIGFVVVLHLPADRKSMLPEIIARWTTMPVAEAADGSRVNPDHVYVIPPGHVGCGLGLWRLTFRAKRLLSTSSSTAWLRISARTRLASCCPAPDTTDRWA